MLNIIYIRKNRTVLITIMFLYLFSGCASSHQKPFPENLPVVRDYNHLLSRMDSLAASNPQLSLITPGDVQYGAFPYPLRAISYTPENPTQYSILITGGVHGNEPAGVEAVFKDVQTIINLKPGTQVIFIPCVNPWGWSYNKRFNKEGRDINRDFASFKCQESRIIRDFTSSMRFSLIIDHHEDPSGSGFYMYQYGKPSQNLCRNIIAAIRKEDFPIEQNVKMVILKTRDGLIDAPMWGLHYMKLTHQLSITNYFRLCQCPDVYTIETPTKADFSKRVLMHKIASEMLIKKHLKEGK